MKKLFFVLFLMFSLACEKKNPHPELLDPIYQDLVSELEIANKSIESEEKALLGLQEELKQAVPQTGQIKYATKKVTEAQKRIDVLRQQRMFFEIKLEQRRLEAAKKYEESLKPGGKPWPDPVEVENYRAVAKLQRDKIAWAQRDNKKTDVPRGTGSEKQPDAVPGTN